MSKRVVVEFLNDSKKVFEGANGFSWQGDNISISKKGDVIAVVPKQNIMYVELIEEEHNGTD